MSNNVVVAVNPPEEQKIVMQVDRPWESRFIAFYSSVLQDEGVFKMWYTCRDKEGQGNVAYAESQDGERWHKPDLGIVEYGGNRSNNLVGIPELEGNVCIDYMAPPDKKFKYLTTVYKEGIFLYSSPDGIHWVKEKEPYMPFTADSQIIAFPDPRLGAYRIYLRGWEDVDQPNISQRKRTVVYMEQASLEGSAGIVPATKAAYLWKDSPFPAIATELPTVVRCDENDDPSCDVYTMAATPYQPDPYYYVAFPALYYHFPDNREAGIINDGRTEVHLMGSTDGLRWHRYNRLPYAKPGLAGSTTSEMMFVGYGMFQKDGQIWQYGAGYRTTHNDTEERNRNSDGVILLLKQRMDGFVSADANYRGGELTTVPLPFEGDRLLINLDAGATGSARIAVFGEEDDPLPGFALEDCDAVRENSLDHLVTWRGSSDLSGLSGKRIRLRISLKSCKLYSLRFEDSGGSIRQ
jgi:hypothetical protein